MSILFLTLVSSYKIEVSNYDLCRFEGVSCKWQLTVALGDVVEFEILPPGTAAWLCTKDKYNLPMFSYVGQAETKSPTAN